MGTKVQLDNYYSMRDLNRDSSGTSWPLCYGENSLSNGQYYYSALPRPSPNLIPGVDKDLVKQKMLEHETVFKNQVFELHRLYRVQKNLMDEIRKKVGYMHRKPCETSSSSSPPPSQMAQRHSSSSFLFTNSGCGNPPISDPENVRSSAGGSLKGKSVQGGPLPFQNCASPKNSEASESRPTKLRKSFDLELPADEYVDMDEAEQCGNGMTSDSGEKLVPSHCEKTKYSEIASRSYSCLTKPNALADLNEPPESEETTANHSVSFLGVQNQGLTKVPGLSEDVSWKPKQGNINGTQNNSHCNDNGSGQNWFSSVLKAEGAKDNGKSIHQINNSDKALLASQPVQVMFENPHHPPGFFPPQHVKEDPWPAKANDGFKMFDKSRSLSHSNNPGLVASHSPSFFASSNLVNSWDFSWGKPSDYVGQNSFSVQTTPYVHSAGLSKCSQSAPQSNDLQGTWWHRNNDPRSNPGFGRETPVQNGFYHGSLSGGCKELPAHFSKPGLDYVNGSYNHKVTSGSSTFLKGTSSVDLNSTRDLNLNVVLPNGLSNEPLVQRGQVKREDPVAVLPWLRAKASSYETASSRNSPNKLESGVFQDPHELYNRGEVRSLPDHQNSVTSTSSNVDATRKSSVISDYPSSGKKILGVPIFQTPLSGEQEIDSSKKKVLLDINVPCDDSEEFGNTAATSEVIFAEERIETGHSNGLRNMIDLNSCLTEDEILSRTSLTNSSTTANSMKKPERGIIDLEAPIDLEAEEDGNCALDEELLMNQHKLPLQSSLQDSTDSLHEKLTRVAAEAIVAISSSAPENHIDDTIRAQQAKETSASGDALSWFADIVCSSPNTVESCPDGNTDCLSSESDSFEEMTLKLTECTVEEHFPNPPSYDFPTVEETGATNPTGRTRRGHPRRGRQRRDFQRDILPGLVSLARHEVTEDLQTFGGLMRATGHAWHCGSRRNSSRNGSGRGRRKTVIAVSPPTPPSPSPAATAAAVSAAAFASQKQLLNNGEIILDDRSLTSWGKTTRRPRRQRCPPAAGNPAPIPLT